MEKGLKPSLEKPATNMPSELTPYFYAGRALAHQPWIKAPTATTSRDGLGPLYNARTCLSCHMNGGKGNIPMDSESPITTTLIRVSVPFDKTQHDPQVFTENGLIPHPVYGDQIQNQSTSLAHQLRHVASAQKLKHDVPPEAYMKIIWQESEFIYPDGSRLMLRKPEVKYDYLGYGAFGKDTMISVRMAPAIHGMGLIELISQKDINDLADEHDANQDGISGRVNQVWDVETQSIQPGRFGLKSNKPTLKMIVAGAFKNDLGITNELFPSQPCSDKQSACLKQAHGNDEEGVELSKKMLKMVVDYNRNLAPIKRNNAQSENIMAGRELFYQLQCQQCHQPSFVTQKSEQMPHLSNQTIWPYSDFLLHDMGTGLADNRPEFLASGSEWRTAPLWNLGQNKAVNGSEVLLHDGRARNVEEAILWHGGEASSAKEAFIKLPQVKRQSLIDFVYSL